MPRPTFAHVRAILLLGLALSASFLASSPALAQENCTEEPCLPPPRLHAPEVTITPGTRAVTGEHLQVEITWRDTLDGLSMGSREIRYGGEDVTAAFSYTWIAGSYHARSVGRIQVRPGPHVLWAGICNASAECGDSEVTYTGPTTAVWVSPDDGVTGVGYGANGGAPFTVRNAGTSSETYTLTAECTGNVTCTSSPSPVAVGAEQSAQVTVTFSGAGDPTSSGVGIVRLRAESGGVWDEGMYTVLVQQSPSWDCEVPLPGENLTKEMCNFDPMVTLSPGDVYVSQPWVPVRVEAWDYLEYLDTASFAVRVDGVDVTGMFGQTTRFEGSPPITRWHRTAVGLVGLSESDPVREVSAALCDTYQGMQLCTTREAEYRLSLPGVEVSPKGGTNHSLASQGVARTFTVTNRGTLEATFALTPQCVELRTGEAVTPCTLDVATVTLSPGGSQVVNLSHGMRVGDELRVTVEASAVGQPGVRDSGWRVVSVFGAGGARLAPEVAVVELGGGAWVERSACVTVAVGPAAAYECGDLRVGHGLPAHRTHGRTWAPALLFNSAHVAPRPTLHLDVGVPEGGDVPERVTVAVTVGETTHTRHFAGSDWRPGMTRRVGVQWWEDASLVTGLHAYALEVTSEYPGETRTTTTGGEFAVVNRGGSGFGPGWWVAGYERLHQTGGNRFLLVGGDGSTRVFTPQVIGSDVVWTAPRATGAADTLRQLAAPDTGYWRRLPGGGEIHYDGFGWQKKTLNRLGQVTTFAREPVHGHLISITAPGGTAIPQWTFGYTSGLLSSVVATVNDAPSRTVSIARGTGGRITTITDPDGEAVRFGYQSFAPLRIATRWDRDDARVRYNFGASGTLTSVRTDLEGTAEHGDIYTYFQAAEAKGVATEPGVDHASVALGATYTRFDGPRTDVVDRTYLWLGRWGAPVRVVDAVGAETRVVRGDARFPGHATEMVDASGVRTLAWYDARGRVDSLVVQNPLGTGWDHLTRYQWDDRWDRPTYTRSYRVRWTSPTTRQTAALGGSMQWGYSAQTGNTIWQQLGDQSRRVHFRYYTSGPAAGQLRATQSPMDAEGRVATDSLWYDARGNLAGTRNALGYVSLVERDALGRDTLTVAPIDTLTAHLPLVVRETGVRQHTRYDVMDRAWQTVSIGPKRVHEASPSGFQPDSTLPERLEVTTTFDPVGRVLTVTRVVDPDPGPVPLAAQVTEYGYDRAGRKTSERNNLVIQYFEYDPAGNTVAWVTGRGNRITNTFDAANRLTRRATPTVEYAHEECAGFPCAFSEFPHYPNLPGGDYRIAEEWTHHRYDAAGRMVHAENAEAVVWRSYYPNGALRTDSTRILGPGDPGGEEVYGLAFAYDMTGRLTSLEHPQNLAGSAAQESFTYDAVTGALTSATDRLGHAFSFGYDLLDRRTSLQMPGGVEEETVYDLAGQVRERWTVGSQGGLPLQHERQVYDARGKVTRVDALGSVGRGASQYTQWYSGLGNLVATDWDNLGSFEWQREEYRVDALGNMRYKRVHTPGPEWVLGDSPLHAYHLNSIHGHVASVHRVSAAATPPVEDDFRIYDGSGNLVQSRRQVLPVGHAGAPYVSETSETRSYYDASERLRVYQTSELRFTEGSYFGSSAGIWEEYRYDPLGRRIGVRTLRGSDICNVDTTTCTTARTRFVWAGDQILWEMREVEYGTSPSEAGGTVSYFHAGGIDRPLTLWKAGVGTLVAHQNWRGQFARGTFASGPRAGESSDCVEYPPQGGCVPVRWPGWTTTAWHETVGKQDVTGYEHYWFGSLAVGMRDASGQMYMRNRYYDPATGQFTQPDPIGLAGGLNTYGFAAGDPVGFWDPFGLCPEISGTTAPCILFAVVMGEARGASREFQIAATNVIKNRAELVNGDYDRVIWARSQFSAMDSDDPNFGVVQAALQNGEVTPQVREVVEGVYNGEIGDNTQGALLYYSPQAMQPRGSEPPWNFGQLRQTLDLGAEGKFFACNQGTSCWARSSLPRVETRTPSGAEMAP